MNMHITKSTCRIVLTVLLVAGCGQRAQGQQEEKPAEIIRPPAVAGGFYPANPTTLTAMIESLLEKVPDETIPGEIVAAVAPHAGYSYSGQVAAHTHKFIAKVDFDTAVIIGHDCHIPGTVALICPADYYQTPLGKVPVDREMVSKMVKFHPGIITETSIHGREHTVEVQLPFFQFFKKQCKIVPVLFGTPTVENCRILAEAIDSAAGNKKVFVLASSDMSHYPSYETARRIDQKTLEIIPSLDVESLFAHLNELETRENIPNLVTSMCARGGVGTAIFFAKARGGNRARVLCYANSGDVPGGDKSRVVGYGSVLIVREAKSGSASKG
jgi:AmmeMemoRadiSam system protein B